MKYTLNPLFWGCFACLLVSAGAVCAVSGVQALNLCFFCFLAWLLLHMVQRSYIQREELFPPLPYGVLSKVAGVPGWMRWALYLIEVLLCAGCCLVFRLWLAAGLVVLLALVFGWLGR